LAQFHGVKSRNQLTQRSSDLNRLGRVLVPTTDGKAQIPVSQLADLKLLSGPAMLRDENGTLNGYVYVDVAGRDVGSYVEEAKRVVREKVKLPAGYSIAWSGQYEAMERVKQRLIIVMPLTLFLILMLLFMNTRSLVKTFVIVLAVPFSAVGAIWFLYLLGYNMSIGVWVGLIALMGVDAETAVFMLLYLDLAYEQARRDGRLSSLRDLQHAIMHGAVKRIRAKFMTVVAMFMGLIPIMWSVGTGADLMKRIAAPMIGGIFTSFVLELVVYPAIYEVWKRHFEVKKSLHLNRNRAVAGAGVVRTERSAI
jgi:Cu(I)/Ag(I) efflux system membrane protein CusA/SilA